MSSTITSSPESTETRSSRTDLNTEGGERWKQDVLAGEVVIEDANSRSRSQAIYEAMGNSKKVLVTLCVGLFREDGSPLIDLSQSPWSQELKGAMKPKNQELVSEVCRRQKLFSGMEGTTTSKQFMMKPKNKSREILIDWLNQWPIRDADCRRFLFAEAQRVEELLQASIAEGRENAIAMQHGAWTGPLPYLRMIHAIIDCNEIRLAFLKRSDAKTREELDSLTSPTRPKTAYEMIADKWNDPEFHPTTQVSKCHYDFASPIDLDHSKVASLVPADAIGIKNRLSSIRVTLLRIIEKWEQSGQGDGGMNDDEEEEGQEAPSAHNRWGKLEGRPQEALDSRENFLAGNPSWYLYFWELTDTYQLLDSTLQRLSPGVGALDANSLQNVSRRRRRHESDDDDQGGDSAPRSKKAADNSSNVIVQNMTNLTNILRELVETTEQDRQEAKRQKEDDYQAALKRQHDDQMAEKERQAEQRIAQLRDSMDEFEEKYELTKKDFYRKILERKQAEVTKLEEVLKAISDERKKRNSNKE